MRFSRQFSLSCVLALAAFAAVGGVVRATPANAPAELKMVAKGVFALREGETIDLTERGILLYLQDVLGEPGQPVRNIRVTINGSGGAKYPIGYRWNLKELQATQQFVSDVRTCFLDIVGAIAPQGAPASASFRLLCE